MSSVAGQRARKANFIYGSSKAGLDAFSQGLGDSLEGTGVGVTIVRPGFVVGRMTEGMTPAPFSTTPEAVADAVVGGIESGAGGGLRPTAAAMGVHGHAPAARVRLAPHAGLSALHRRDGRRPGRPTARWERSSSPVAWSGT